jgi:hypothetical protein
LDFIRRRYARTENFHAVSNHQIRRTARKSSSSAALDLSEHPEPIRQDDLVQQFLNATGDARTVITDPNALYFGITVNDQSLTPGDNPRLGPTRFADWLNRND